jgi:hypothetical protein
MKGPQPQAALGQVLVERRNPERQHVPARASSRLDPLDVGAQGEERRRDPRVGHDIQSDGVDNMFLICSSDPALESSRVRTNSVLAAGRAA